MSIRELPPLLVDDPGLIQALGRRDGVIAVPEVARPITLAAIADESERQPILVVVPTSTDAERLHNDLTQWVGEDRALLFPAWETLPFERLSPGTETMGRRLAVLHRLSDPDTHPRIVVAPVRAALQRLGPGATEADPVVVGVGDQIDATGLVERLVSMGYRREFQVEHRGEVAVRGSIVDVFGSTADGPVRIDLWGDEVDRLSPFSVADQRSAGDLAEATFFGCREVLPTAEVRERAEALIASDPWGREQWSRLADGEIFDGMESWLPWLVDDERLVLDLLGPDAMVVLAEPRRMKDRATNLADEEADLASTLAVTWGAVSADSDRSDARDSFPHLHLGFDRLLGHAEVPVWHLVNTPDGPDGAMVTASGWGGTLGEVSGPMRQIQDLLTKDFRILIAADGEGSADRLVTLLAEAGISAGRRGVVDDLTEPGVHVMVAPLEFGCVLSSVRLAVCTEAELTGRRRSRRRPRKRRRDAQAVFEDLQAGNHVVHAQHGVARYAGMVTRAIGGVERDYLLLEYRGDDKLYVPSDQIAVAPKYAGGDSPSLSRLSSGDWQRAKAKVRVEVAAIAQELVVLYQRRITTPGNTFGPDTPWQGELEAAFPFQETPDQLEAIESVKADMEANRPMDRLVCGDVGFGKTEVAVRAAFKAVQDGFQAVILVPTTLLAQQHGQTFADRYSGFPVRVETLSRFQTNAEAKKITEGLASGEVDVVIGTHRILSGDIEFSKLGLLVIDEEQRFGVKHKEAMKELQTGVDVLTLTATPIPRTLEMSLTGIRDLSLLKTPPAERQPILTYVGEYDDRPVAEAIRRELLRDGQVFFVHNRVSDIGKIAADLQELVPEARIAIAHGQMDENSLETVVMDFWDGQYDVLVCTTIVESGIDMPTVNTLVVDRAERLGLGQLHQLRGRVGRAGQRAYAYLFHAPDTVLSEDAYERLKTIGETTELGSGFEIAMRDLEIRGAGNLLGTGQSGHISAVGYDLYCQMVNEAVAELKGETPPEPIETKIELPVDASIPSDYIGREEQRLEAYRRLADAVEASTVDDIKIEWQDRYGPVPAEAEALLSVARLRVECRRLGITELTVAPGDALGPVKHMVKMSPIKLRVSQELRLERLHKGRYVSDRSMLAVGMRSTKDLPGDLTELLHGLVPPGDETPLDD